ncbi:hypothetical protein ACE7GA_20005 [Roseomonas sp. CCTCC AB2023176]|uniref:hypothetical protein n=1 Tax=Roseomonas sp. CCTCC AB2023176 TaxID=3342640 RepID=UPI0035E10C24
MSDDLLSADPNWAGVARFLEGRIARGQRVTAPIPFERVTGPLSAPDPGAVPDWAVVHKGQLAEYPQPVLGRLASEATPVFANDVFVVFARRPTFGLRSQRSSVHVNALFERLREMGLDVTDVPAAPPKPLHPAPEPTGALPTLPPEALALASPPAPRPAIETAPEGLRTQAAALLALRPEARVAGVGLAIGLGSAIEDPGQADAIVLRVRTPADLGALDRLREAGRPAAPVLIVADNARSLGRRLARAAGRAATDGVALPELLGALRAAGLRPGRAEGFSLDPWRAAADAPPPDQRPGSPGGDVLDQAGRDAGPDHAALLLVLATQA